MNDLPQVPHAKVMACMLEDILPKLRIGLVSDEYERYRRLRGKQRLPADQEAGSEDAEQSAGKTS